MRGVLAPSPNAPESDRRIWVTELVGIEEYDVVWGTHDMVTLDV